MATLGIPQDYPSAQCFGQNALHARARRLTEVVWHRRDESLFGFRQQPLHDPELFLKTPLVNQRHETDV